MELPSDIDRGPRNPAGTIEENWVRSLLLLFVFSIAFMHPALRISGFNTVPSDFICLALAGLWALLAISGRVAAVWDRAYWFIIAYFLALAASALASEAPLSSAAKLATQVYLLSIPILVCCIVRDEGLLRKVTLWWLAGTAVMIGVGAASLLLFILAPDNPMLDWTRYRFGTLPPGAYPRLQLTFRNANLACNYLTVSLMLLLAARRAGWVTRRHFALLLVGILAAAIFTISPGLGGIGLALGLSLWLDMRERRPVLARLVLWAGAGVAFLFVVAMAVTPFPHATAPFLIQVPMLDVTLAPSGRLMVWLDAVRNVLKVPLLGQGIGVRAVMVQYVDPSGNPQRLTDAHNLFLSIAAQCGLIGLAALLALIAHIARRTLPLRISASPAGIMRLGAGLGLLNGLVYQGLGGSFEDARHLWLAFGLLIACARIERGTGLSR